MTVDEIEDKLDTLQTGGLIGQTRAFMIGMNECRYASIESRRLADSGGSFYTITLDRLPIEVAAEIIATFMNCRSA